MSVPPIDPAYGKLTSRFGMRKLQGKDDLHTGIDIHATIGEPVRAVTAGRVVLSEPPGKLAGYGNVIVVEHPSNVTRAVYSLYAHMSERFVVKGDNVIEGQVIGAVGDTGGARGDVDHHIGAPHLHFELLTRWPPSGKDQDRIDPTRLWPPSTSSASSTPSNASRAPRVTTQPSAPSSGSGALVVLAAIYALMQALKKKTPIGS